MVYDMLSLILYEYFVDAVMRSYQILEIANITEFKLQRTLSAGAQL